MSTYGHTQQLPIGGTADAQRRRIIVAAAIAVLIAGLLATLLYTAGRYGGPEPTVVSVDELVGADVPVELPNPDLNPAPGVDVPDDDAEAPDSPAPAIPEATATAAPTPATDAEQPQPTAAPTSTPAATPTPAPTPAVDPEPVPSDEPPEPLTDEEEDAFDPTIPDELPDEPPPVPAEELEPDIPEPEPTPDPIDLDPVDGVNDDVLCHDVELAGKTLYVQSPVVLDAGSMSSTVSIMNCSDSPQNWTALAPGWVSLDASDGELAPGAVTQLGFAVQPGSVDAGAFDFPIKVNTPTEFSAAQVHGFRAAVGSDFAGPDSLSNGPATCQNPCIRKAELRNSPVSTDVILDVETTTPAKVVVTLSTGTPTIVPNGSPASGIRQVAAVSEAPITEWTTVLTDLLPTTQYHIAVYATDEAGNRWIEAGTFTTGATVQPGDKAVEPLGCKIQCIDSALVSFGEAFDTVYVEVTTSPAADIVAMISTQAPFYSAGVPQFADIEASGGSNGPTTFLSHSLPVTPGALYHVIVQATDDAGQSSYQVGAFNAPSPPPPPPVPETLDVVVTFLRGWVTEDGDAIGKGELRFPWQAGTHVDYRWQQRMNTGDSFWYTPSATYHFDDLDVEDKVPLIAVSVWERDWGTYLAEGDSGISIAPRINPNYGLLSSISTLYTSAYIDSLVVGDVAGLASCESYGIGGEWASERCIELTTVDPGHWDFPTMRAVIAIQAAPTLAVPPWQ